MALPKGPLRTVANRVAGVSLLIITAFCLALLSDPVVRSTLRNGPGVLITLNDAVDRLDSVQERLGDCFSKGVQAEKTLKDRFARRELPADEYHQALLSLQESQRQKFSEISSEAEPAISILLDQVLPFFRQVDGLVAKYRLGFLLEHLPDLAADTTSFEIRLRRFQTMLDNFSNYHWLGEASGRSI